MSKTLHQNSELIVRDGGRMHPLNGTASAVWRMLDEPATSAAIIRQFRFLYPEEDARHLKSSLRSLLEDLSDRDILKRMKKRRAN